MARNNYQLVASFCYTKDPFLIASNRMMQ